MRLVGPRRVEIYEPGLAVRVLAAGDTLTAPDFLELPIPVEALWDPATADRVSLRNLLQRFGYRDVDAIREEGGVESLRASVRAVLASRRIAPGPAEETRLAGESDPEIILEWIRRAAVASEVGAVFGE